MFNLIKIILVAAAVLAGGIYAKNAGIISNFSPAPGPSSVDITKEEVLEVTPKSEVTPKAVPVDESTLIGPEESAKVQCGEGNAGVHTKWKGKGLSFSADQGTSLGGQVELTVEVVGADLKPANGALVTWYLYDRGSLRINGCNAIFTAPDSIGTASSASGNVSVRIEVPKPSSESGAGEAGPTFAGYATTARMTIKGGNNTGGGSGRCSPSTGCGTLWRCTGSYYSGGVQRSVDACFSSNYVPGAVGWSGRCRQCP